MISELKSPKLPKLQNIDPGSLELVILTSCNCNLNCFINIEMIFNKLPIDETINAIKLENNVRGEPFGNCKKKKKGGRDFVNYITIVVKHQGQQINVKLFGNGKMVITGANC